MKIIIVDLNFDPRYNCDVCNKTGVKYLLRFYTDLAQTLGVFTYAGSLAVCSENCSIAASLMPDKWIKS